MSATAPFYQLVEHPWVLDAPASSTSGGTRASVVNTPVAGPAPRMPDVARDAALACSTSKAYLVGGNYTVRQARAGPSRPTADAYEFSFASRSWCALPPLPAPVTQAKAVAVEDDVVFVTGGWTGDAYSGAVWLLAPQDHPSLLPAGRDGAVGKGTASAADSAAKNDKKARVKEAGESKRGWRLLPPPVDVHGHAWPAPCPRVGHTVVKGSVDGGVRNGPAEAMDGGVMHDDIVLYLFGGFDGQQWLNDVWRLQVGPSLRRGECVWERLTTGGCGAMVSPFPRSDAALAFDGVLNRLYVCFGRSCDGLLNDVWELDLATRGWRALTTSGTVMPRFGAAAVVPDGVHLYVLAGEGDAQQCIPQLLRLSLRNYQWSLLRPTATASLLAGRDGFVATGGSAGERGCLVFGGAGSSAKLVELALDAAHATDASAKRK